MCAQSTTGSRYTRVWLAPTESFVIYLHLSFHRSGRDLSSNCWTKAFVALPTLGLVLFVHHPVFSVYRPVSVPHWSVAAVPLAHRFLTFHLCLPASVISRLSRSTPGLPRCPAAAAGHNRGQSNQ